MNITSPTWSGVKKVIALILGIGVIACAAAFMVYTFGPEDSATAKAGSGCSTT